MPSKGDKSKTVVFSKKRIISIALVLLASIFFALIDVDLYAKIITLLPYDENNAFLDKKVWITGSSSGIGRSLALELCTAGWDKELSI